MSRKSTKTASMDNIKTGMCPNYCGKLVLFKNPITITPTEDVVELIINEQEIRLWKHNEEEIVDIVLVLAACQECGYAVVNHVSEDVAFGGKKN